MNIIYLRFLGVATRLPRPADLLKYAESCMYTPNYRSYLQITGAIGEARCQVRKNTKESKT